jgi:anti-sigma regulatory factor (Ser/Thr protein kinase)
MDLRVPRYAECGVGMHRYLCDSEEDQVVIDLGEATWTDPFGLVGIAALAEWHITRGQEVRLVGPIDDSRARYLARMGLGDVLDELKAEHDLPTTRSVTHGTLLELQRFDGQRGAADLAERVLELHKGIDRDAADRLHSALIEVGANVPDHSGLPHGYIAAQMTHSRSVLRFAVADSGTGVRTSLREHSPADDADAIELALRRHISDSGERGRGRGLTQTLELILEGGGTFHMSSGRAGVSISPGGKQWRTYPRRVRGTVVQGTLPSGPTMNYRL